MSVKLPASSLAELEGKQVVLVTSSGQIKVGTFIGVKSLGMKDCIKLDKPTSLINISYMESIDEVTSSVAEEEEANSKGSNPDLVGSQ